MAAPDAKSEAKRQPAPGYHPMLIALAAAAAGMVVDRNRPLPVAIWWTIAATALGRMAHSVPETQGRGGGAGDDAGRGGPGRFLAP